MCDVTLTIVRRRFQNSSFSPYYFQKTLCKLPKEIIRIVQISVKIRLLNFTTDEVMKLYLEFFFVEKDKFLAKNPSFVRTRVGKKRSSTWSIRCKIFMGDDRLLAMNRRFVTGSCRGELAHNGLVESIAYSVH